MKENRQIINQIMAVLMLVSMVLVAKEAAEYVVSQRPVGAVPGLVVIDAGHGGKDGGKNGVGGIVEKELNLAIAFKVKELLEQQDIQVIMTREDDWGSYPKSGSNKKLADMKKRVALINGERPSLTVSIHQNAFSDASVSGAQTFYYGNSDEGRVAAEILQEQLIKTLQPKKERVAKANESYYMLKNTQYPTVIVECGFLTNPEDAKLLCQEDYQQQVAWAISLGILRYLNLEK